MSDETERARNYAMLKRAEDAGMAKRRQARRCEKGCALASVYVVHEKVVITTHGYNELTDEGRRKVPFQAWIDESPGEVRAGCRHGIFWLHVDENWRISEPRRTKATLPTTQLDTE